MASSGEPMDAITVGPEVRFPKTCAGRGAVKVTIASARATEPVCPPITSESAPEGMSTAITGVVVALIFAIAWAYIPLTGGRKPEPRMASTNTSHLKTSSTPVSFPPLKIAKAGVAEDRERAGAALFLRLFRRGVDFNSDAR